MLKQKNFLFIIYCLVIIIITISCSLEPGGETVNKGNSSQGNPEVTVSDNSGNVILGRKLENPYSVRNMKLAKESLVLKGIIIQEEINTTHYYIRFSPANINEIEELCSMPELSLFNIPMDYEILSEGDTYRDPDITEDKPDYQYSVVPVNKKLPNVEYKIIEELFIPGDLSESISSENCDFVKLKNESLSLTGNTVNSRSGNILRGEYCAPYGKITLYDNILNKNVPIPGVKVRMRSFGKTVYAYTDDNGNYKMPYGYYLNFNYSLEWRHGSITASTGSALQNNFDAQTKFYITDEKRGVATYNGLSNTKNCNKNFDSSDGKSHFHAKIHRAAFYFWKYFNDYRANPFYSLPIHAMYSTKAPDNFNYPAFYSTGNSKVRKSLQVNFKNSTGEKNWLAVDDLILFATLGHEFGHAMHHKINAEYKKVNNPVQESWANLTGWLMVNKYYPYKINIADDNTKTAWKYVTRQFWHPGIEMPNYTPFLIDMMDHFNQGNYDSQYIDEYYIDDKVWDYPLVSIIDIIGNKTVRNLHGLGNKIKRLPRPRGVTAANLDAYINQYLSNKVVYKEDFNNCDYNNWNGWKVRAHGQNFYSNFRISGKTESYMMDDLNGKALRTYISDRGSRYWTISGSTPELNTKVGFTYEVRFKARTESSCSRKIRVQANNNDANYIDFNINDQMKEYVYTTTSNSKIVFYMGNLGGNYSCDVIIDDVVITRKYAFMYLYQK